MNAPFLQVIIFLLIGIALIILLTAKYRVHAFFALLIACLVTGLGAGIAMPALLNIIKDGFGNIMRSLGLIIVFGTSLGVILEHTGSTKLMANYILKKVGKKNAALAISITGLIVGLPVFCDSGYIVLSGLTKSLSKKTGMPIVVMSISLATGLYSVHCLIPPHPGATAAAATIGVDAGRLILYGIIIAIPTMIVGHKWAIYAGKKTRQQQQEENATEENEEKHSSTIKAFLPIIIPILLITVKSFFTLQIDVENKWRQFFSVIGDPVIALSIGILLAFNAGKDWNKNITGALLTEAAEKAGGILVIIGAGGAFGAVLAATNMAEHLNNTVALQSLGILFPFLLAFILKTAQGSSTVAIITAAAIVLPMLPALHLDHANGRLLAVLSMGAGSMMISHTNDAYFWVISKFSGIDIKTMLRVYSVGSALMGLTGLLMIYILSFILS